MWGVWNSKEYGNGTYNKLKYTSPQTDMINISPPNMELLQYIQTMATLFKATLLLV